MGFFRRSMLTFFLVIPFIGIAADVRADETWKDPVSGKIWHVLSHSINWHEALAGCENLDAEGDSSYRLPTLEEWWDAYDRIKGTSLAQSLQTLQLQTWTADPFPGTKPQLVWSLYLQSGNGGGLLATALASAACVH
jgi:hypothetical protein